MPRRPVLPVPQLVDVLGVHVRATRPDDLCAEIDAWIEHGERRYVCFTGVHGVMESQGDPALLAAHNGGVVVADGMPLVWAARRVGVQDAARVYGPDFMLQLLGAAAAAGRTSYFYGGKEGVPELMRERLSRLIPGLQVVGTYSPPFRPLTAAEETEVVERINAAAPDLVWVGLSTPKQERWMATMRPRLDAAALLGVGAAFDFHAGLLRQAPDALQAAGLEWAFRLAVEPRRLWRRYLSNNPRFVARLAGRPPRVIG